MKNLLLRVGAIALALLAVPAASQGVVQLPQVKNAGGSNVPSGASVSIDSTGVEKGTIANPVVVGAAGATTFTLMTGATAAATQSPAAGIYSLQLPSAFNGATITLTLTTVNGTVATHAYTSAASAKTCFRLSAGTTASVAAAGGTPTGNTILAGAAQCSQPVVETYTQLALTANTAAQIATPITGMINGLVCSASSANSADVLVGTSAVTTTETGAGNGYPIIPGGAWAGGISTTANTWFISAAAAVIYCHGN